LNPCRANSEEWARASDAKQAGLFCWLAFFLLIIRLGSGM
jgi:hypothetical protein